MSRASNISKLARRTRAFGLLTAAVLAVGCASSEEPTAERREEGGVITAAEIPQQQPQQQPITSQLPQGQNAFAFPTGDRNTSTILLERITPQEVRLNRPYDYQIRVTNLTDQPLNNVVVREQTPGSLQITKAEPTTRPAEGGFHEYQIGELGPKESRTINVSGTPSQEGPLSTCMTVTYTPTLCVTTNVVNPIIRLSLAGPGQALQCDQLTYRYTVRNEGTGTERNVQIVDQLPEGLTTVDGQNQVTLNFGDVAAGQSVERTVNLRAQRTGQFSHQAVTKIGDQEIKSEQVTTTIQKPNLAVQVQGPDQSYIGEPVTYQVTVTNTGDAPARDLAMNVDAPGRTEVAAVVDGQPKLLSVQGAAQESQRREEQPRQQEPQQRGRVEEGGRYRGAGGPGEPDVNLIPGQQGNGGYAREGTEEGRREEQRSDRQEGMRTEGGEARVTAAGPGGQINLGQQGIGPLGPGQSQTFNVTVPQPQAGVLRLSVAANAYCADAATGSAQTNIQALSGLLLTAVDEADPIRVGNNVVYVITVRNQGTGADNNIQVTATLPEGIQYVRATGPTQPQVEGQRLTFAPVDTLGGGQTITWRVEGRAQNAGDKRFRVELRSQNVTGEPALAVEPTRLY